MPSDTRKTSPAGGLFDCASGFDAVEHLLRPGRCAVIDMTVMDPRVASLMVDLLAAQLLYPRLYARTTVDATACCLVIDEADPVCSIRSASMYPEGYAPLGEYAKRGREAGLGSCIAVSFFDQCSPYITGNCTAKALFVPQNPESVREAVRTLLLPWEGARLLTSLGTGQCVYVESQSPWPHPVLVQVDQHQHQLQRLHNRPRFPVGGIAAPRPSPHNYVTFTV